MQMERIWVNGRWVDRPHLTVYDGTIKKYKGIWRCTHPLTSSGIGKTPKEAYNDWLAYRVAAVAARMSR